MDSKERQSKEILKELKPDAKTTQDYNNKKPDVEDPNENGTKPDDKVQPDLPDEQTPEK